MVCSPRFEVRYTDVLQLIDQLLIKHAPDQTDINRLKYNVPYSSVAHKYFFDHLSSSDWLLPLANAGFFSYPPPIEIHTDGTTTACVWPASKYLVRMAPLDPQSVAEIAAKVQTENPWVHADLIEAARLLPSNLSIRLVPIAMKWLEFPYPILGTDLIGMLAVHLAVNGEIENALILIRELLAVLPDPDPAKHSYWSPKPVLRVESYEYHQILEKVLPELSSRAGFETLSVLTDLLDRAIELSITNGNDARPTDHSSIHIANIDTPIGDIHWGVVGYLVNALRNTVDFVCDQYPDSVPKVVDEFSGRQWNMFQRFALRLMVRRPDLVSDRIHNSLIDHGLFENSDAHSEYGRLAAEHFHLLSPEEQATITGWIDSGPELTYWISNHETLHGGPPTKEEVASMVRTWKIHHVCQLLKVLPNRWKNENKEICVAALSFGSEVAMSESSGNVYGSPPVKTADQLNSMSTASLIKYLKEWCPNEDRFGPSPESLARELSTTVKSHPAKYALRAAKFLDISEPAYINGIMTGFLEACRAGTKYNWKGVLELADWAVGQPRPIPGKDVGQIGYDTNWGTIRQTIAGLLETGLQMDVIPFNMRTNAWSILSCLIQDPEPTAQQESEDNDGAGKAMSLSLNTVRGKAAHAVIEYGIWCKKHLFKARHKKDVCTITLAQMQETSQAFDQMLDPRREPSLAVRAVFGARLHRLMWLDSEWTRKSARRIFPLSAKQKALREAAWTTFVNYGLTSPEMLDLLRPMYRVAVAELIGSELNEDRIELYARFGGHLIWHYVYGKLSLTAPRGLLRLFLKNAPEETRARSVSIVGTRLCDHPGQLTNSHKKRLLAYWDNRLTDAIQKPERKSELRCISGTWFCSPAIDERFFKEATCDTSVSWES